MAHIQRVHERPYICSADSDLPSLISDNPSIASTDIVLDTSDYVRTLGTDTTETMGSDPLRPGTPIQTERLEDSSVTESACLYQTSIMSTTVAQEARATEDGSQSTFSTTRSDSDILRTIAKSLLSYLFTDFLDSLSSTPQTISYGKAISAPASTPNFLGSNGAGLIMAVTLKRTRGSRGGGGDTEDSGKRLNRKKRDPSGWSDIRLHACPYYLRYLTDQIYATDGAHWRCTKGMPPGKPK